MLICSNASDNSYMITMTVVLGLSTRKVELANGFQIPAESVALNFTQIHLRKQDSISSVLAVSEIAG